MTAVPSLVFLLDTPNIWRGRALAGTPARVLALAEHSRRAGAAVTLALCDRGADYGTAADWQIDVLLVHPADFYAAEALSRILATVSVDFLFVCEAEALVATGRDLAALLGARLVYDVHDDEAAVAASLGEPQDVVKQNESTQRAALRIADYVIVSTPNETRMVTTAQVTSAHTAMLPNGADPHVCTYWGPRTDSVSLVFLGNLYYEPNARALAAIRTVILPSLRAAGFKTHARVIGRGSAELTKPAEGIEFTGRVNTINEALQDVTLALAPLTAGSGAKMKVLDYLAAGLPVLGTSEAVTGLPPDHPGVVVENDLRAWPSLIAALLRDPAALREIGLKGRQAIEQELSWQQIGADLLRHAHTWLTRTPAVPPDIVASQVRTPRWLTEHAAHNALGDPQTTTPGRPHRLCHASKNTSTPISERNRWTSDCTTS